MTQAQPQPKTKVKKQRGAPTEQKRRITGLLAILLAALGGLAVFSSLGAQEDKGKVFVLRAKQTILPLTPITEAQLEVVLLPAESVEPGALKATTAEAVLAAAKDTTADTNVIGRYALYTILTQQQIRIPSMLSADARLLVNLGPDERLVTINVPLARGVAGLVRTGDRIDLYTVSSESQTSVSQLLAEDIEVVLVAPGEDTVKAVGEANPGQDPLSRLPNFPVPALYVLRVPVSLVTTVVSADAVSSLYLVYRPVAEAGSELTQDPASAGTSSTPMTTQPRQQPTPSSTPVVTSPTAGQ
jgi:Flp pilus assembly protein CpaB